MRLAIRGLATLALILTAFVSLASAHYHFIHFNGRSAPWRGAPEKFDLKVLPDKTVSYFITDQTGVEVAPKDSYVGLISQIRAAAKVWNDVETSELRLGFGGFAAPNTAQSAPSMEIVFEDVPPGLIAAGAPRVKLDSNGEFVPILKSVVMLSPNLQTNPSFSEKMFGTLVHEIGHALGLQHTFTSSVMSTRITRSTSRAKTLTSDDVAGISRLYPTGGFAKKTGTVSGRVSMSGSGVNLASVVAISTSGPAISTLTNPDGSYEIAGLTPQQYFVYVHPLPPAQQGQSSPGDIVFPQDSEGQPIRPSGPFQTIFYPGTNDPSRAFSVSAKAGAAVTNIDFEVRSRSGYGIHSVDTYSYPGSFAMKPAYLSPSMTYPFLVAGGSGLFSGNEMASGLSVSVLGGASLPVNPYSPAPASYVQIDFDVRTLSIAADGPRHLVFSRAGDIYVLPAAFFHVKNLPPSVEAVLPITEDGRNLAVISGGNLSEASRVFFDGVVAPVKEFDGPGKRLIVTPPQAPLNHRASVVVFNPDGQSSLFLQGDAPSTYTYASETASFGLSSSVNLTVSPSTLPSGVDAMLQIDAATGVFAGSQTALGFGSSDILVRDVAVISPTRLLVNVSVAPNAQPGFVHLSIASGLGLISQQFALQVATSGRPFWLKAVVLNAATDAPEITAGATAILTIGKSPFEISQDNVTLRMDDKPIPGVKISENRITFQVPPGASPGPAVLRIEANGERSLPILMRINPPLPRILTATAEEGSKKLRNGQLVTLTVRNLQSTEAVVEQSRIGVSLGGVDLRIAQVTEQEGSHKVVVYFPDNSPTGLELPLTLSIGGRVSAPVAVTLSE